ncbi:transmembrane protein, putative (macronuclear) [Tetrahymena thermophila SB210]|uniref:Transmembrane protein, putative n=1 Tax=Tetrahymena thermophila (strain SB210) TaxID=312017 RepID=I7LWV0_TETTS|nr:transmembrane protein, putative [Tetrahymena thermophila SB210]EAS02909.2 transmembrane protein, putative [Tetrahymena thermophila SB210]|eukprot:XP_001023154.2 transmembrane protein, putative [Tetrahymena thermophila SB210]
MFQNQAKNKPQSKGSIYPETIENQENNVLNHVNQHIIQSFSNLQLEDQSQLKQERLTCQVLNKLNEIQNYQNIENKIQQQTYSPINSLEIINLNKEDDFQQRNEQTAFSRKIDESLKSQKNQNQFRKSSTILDDEYFFEENKQTICKKSRYINPEQFHKIRDHQVEWNFKAFFEFLLYHFFFYFLTGPFTYLIFYKKEKLMKNLSFWGNNSYFYMQSLLYFSNSLNLILYFSSNSTQIFTVEIVYMEIVLFLRAYIISCKYATLHPDKIELYRNYELQGELTLQDYYFSRWVFQSDITVYRESYNAFQRNEFDSSLFYMNFIVNPSQESVKQFEDGILALQKWHKYDNMFITPCIYPQDNYTYGYGIVYFLIKNFTKDNPNSILTIIAIVLGIFRGVLLLIFRYIDKESHYTNFSTIEIVQMVGIVYNTSFGYFSSLVFLIFFVKDLKLKNYLQKQCILLLSPKKLNVGVQKLLPTINFTDPYSIKALSTLRRLLLDYGKAYYLRLEAFISVYVFVAVFSLATLILWLFDVYSLPNNIGVACGFESLVIFFLLFYLLIQGAIINTNFEINKNIIFDYQIAFDDIIRLRKFYFHIGSKSSNMVRQKIISAIKQKFQLTSDLDEKQDERVLQYLNEIKECFNDCYKEVKQDSITQPFLFFGIKITTVLIQNILVALGTSAVGLIQYYIRQKQ